jgi:hypothetical protein
MTDPIDDGDPGWGGFLPGLLALVPGGLQYLQRRSGPSGRNPLVMLCGMFTAFAFALVMVGVVVVLVAGDLSDDPLPAAAVAVGVAAVGAFSLVAARFVDRPLDCSSDLALVGTYRTRFFLRLMFADTAALIGFVGVIMCDEAWIYAVGLPFAAVGFLRAAPSRGNIERDQEVFTSAGCGRSLSAALQNPEPAG